jgi:ribosomal protein L11
MLNLQNILAIFSITETELKFSVVEKSVDTKNIIFHQATKNNNVYTINETLGENPIFVKMFKELINRAEKNIGMPITKVVIFVEDDDTFSITKTSKTFNLYGNVVTLEKAKELLGELSIDNVEKKTHVFSNINK